MNKSEVTVIDYTKDIEGMHDRMRELVVENKTFEVVNVALGKQSLVVKVIESAIEERGKTCRVRTNGRGFAAAALAIPTLGASLAAGAAIAAHNLATKDPDYEIIKDMFGSGVKVVYFKNKSLIDSATGEWW